MRLKTNQISWRGEASSTAMVVPIRILIRTTVVWIRCVIGTAVVRIRILIGTTVVAISSPECGGETTWGEISSCGETTSGETTRGGNGLGAKRPGVEFTTNINSTGVYQLDFAAGIQSISREFT